MAAAPAPLTFDTGFDPQVGRPVSVAPGVTRVSAGNAGPFTFTGTNSFLVGRRTVAVVDPGPDDDAHLQALLTAIADRPVTAILLTHTHNDHSALAPRLRNATGAPLWLGRAHRPSRDSRPFEPDRPHTERDPGIEPDRILGDGEMLSIDGMALTAIATPGHCSNHLCFAFPDTPWLLSGDHVMGWSSTVVQVPDGSMADYLASLERLVALPYRHYLPAHGGAIGDGPGYAAALLRHRQLRNEEIVRAVENGARSIGAVLKSVYPRLALPLLPAARMTVRAHVEYLADHDRIRARFGRFGVRLAPRNG